jgi:hypothetical protein
LGSIYKDAEPKVSHQNKMDGDELLSISGTSMLEPHSVYLFHQGFSPVLLLCACAGTVWCLVSHFERLPVLGQRDVTIGWYQESFIKWQACGKDKCLLGSRESVTKWLSKCRLGYPLMRVLALAPEQAEGWREAPFKSCGSALPVLDPGDNERWIAEFGFWWVASQPRRDTFEFSREVLNWLGRS